MIWISRHLFGSYILCTCIHSGDKRGSKLERISFGFKIEQIYRNTDELLVRLRKCQMF